MQTRYPYLKKLIPLAFMGFFALLFISCGTYNKGYGETDGIYATETETETASNEVVTDKTNYYKQYFKSKENAYEDLPEEDLIFTDIEAYSTKESLDEDGYVVIEEEAYNDGYGAWGDNSEDITINVYNYGGGYYGGFYGHYYNPYWYGYWCRPYWSIGYSWGYPYYGYGWGYPYYYYGGYYGHYYNPYYAYGGYYSNIAYNRGRRNLDYPYGRSVSRGKFNVSDGRSSYSRSELTRRNNTNSVRSNSSFTRDRSSNIRRNSTLNNTRSNSNNNSIRNTRTTRPNTNSVRNNNSVRRSNSVSRPSSSSNNSRSSVRSSGSSSRSSSSSRGSGGRRGGGGLE